MVVKEAKMVNGMEMDHRIGDITRKVRVDIVERANYILDNICTAVSVEDEKKRRWE